MRVPHHGDAGLPTFYEFGPFSLDCAAGTLRSGEKSIHLRPRSFQLLSYLVRHPGQVKSKCELIDAVWGPVAITDDAVAQCIIDIRRALGDSKRQIVKTVPRRGYLLNVPVKILARKTRAAMAEKASQRRKGLAHLSQVLALVVLVAFVASMVGAAAGEERGYSVAVMPFDDFSASQDLGYFGDSVSEEILNVLTPIPELRVVSRTSSFSLRHKRLDVKAIAERLQVSHVLEGSVREAGGRFRVTAQLIEAQTGGHLWSATFEVRGGDLLAFQDQIARAVVERLSESLGISPAATMRASAGGGYCHVSRRFGRDQAPGPWH